MNTKIGRIIHTFKGKYPTFHPTILDNGLKNAFVNQNVNTNRTLVRLKLALYKENLS